MVIKTDIKNNKQVYAVEMRNITKTFLQGKIVANKDLHLKVKKNTIHAIIGENGAGKSTLMSILFGIYQPDSGEILINGVETNFKSANNASVFGLGMVHQHFKLVDNYPLWKNVILGSEISTLGFINKREVLKQLEFLNKKYHLNVELEKITSEVGVVQQQKIEILKLLYKKADILIFDEPTAILNDIEITQFLKTLQNFKKEGKTIIIITHKLHEVKEVADEATVIRFGRNVSEVLDVKKTTTEKMAQYMVGKDLDTVHNNDQYANLLKKPVLLEVSDLSLVKHEQKNWLTILKDQLPSKKGVHHELHKLSFKLRAGEILGIAGVEGNGQTELALILGGLLKAKKGSVKILDSKTKSMVDVTNKSINKLRENKISYVPEDRHKHGLILDDSIAMNTVIGELDSKKFSFLGFINKSKIFSHAKKIIKSYDVRGATNGSSIARQLSGGNQQKLIIGREIERDHQLLILVQPTRGLDLGAIEWIQKLILQEKTKGKGIVLISYELDELISLSDSIAVISKNQFLVHKPKNEISRNEIGLLMAGKKKGVNHEA